MQNIGKVEAYMKKIVYLCPLKISKSKIVNQQIENR